jgi:hypothetical protein
MGGPQIAAAGREQQDERPSQPEAPGAQFSGPRRGLDCGARGTTSGCGRASSVIERDSDRIPSPDSRRIGLTGDLQKSILAAALLRFPAWFFAFSARRRPRRPSRPIGLHRSKQLLDSPCAAAGQRVIPTASPASRCFISTGCRGCIAGVRAASPALPVTPPI